ncbi:MAG: diaminopimelate epimerase [Alphaproteobacteria bacterium]|nr:diaminopimelate epimerase [Alphaproteobacteria bacterium]
MTYEFIKMNGLGNDFVIFDGRTSIIHFTPQELSAIADRHMGVGCDQIIILEPALNPNADLFMRIYNANGSEAEACGNAARCVTWLMTRDLKSPSIDIETVSGLRHGRCVAENEVEVEMGQASFEWDKIPLSYACDTLSLDLPFGLKNASVVNVGNPHLIYFIEEDKFTDIHKLSSELECYSLFPQGININAARIINSKTIKLEVWERGVGLTRACGTGACATVAVAVKKNLVAPSCRVIQPGGSLKIEIDADNHIKMTGQVAENFRGSFPSSFFQNTKS